ncbi:unnamed protein product [Rotaria sp. Silwood2]|nr:unnamed protein product [Rotaria sp. Silwood2]CAF4588062.1 unnamed protein product [Rotaria sp. Silwood2]
MNMDKTKFAREHDSEEIDLGQYIDDDDVDEEKENDVHDNFDISTSVLHMSPAKNNSINSKENSMDKLSECYSSSKYNITYTKKNKPSIGKGNLALHFLEYIYVFSIDFDTVYNTSSTSNKRHVESDSSLDGTSRVVKKKRADMNDSSKMLNKLLNRKKPSTKKKNKTTPIIDESKYVTREEFDLLSKDHTDLKKSVKRMIPIVKHFRGGKKISLDSSATNTGQTTALSNIEEINKSIKKIFRVEASEVTGPRDRPTIVIRHLFRLSNHLGDYLSYLNEHADLLQAFLQYRCPGIIDMKDTWLEVEAAMKTLANDVKKNSKTKEVRGSFKLTANLQQQPAASTNDEITAPLDNVEREEII